MNQVELIHYLHKLNAWLNKNRHRRNPDFQKLHRLLSELEKQYIPVSTLSILNKYHQNIFRILLKAGFDFSINTTNLWFMNQPLKQAPSSFILLPLFNYYNRVYFCYTYVHSRPHNTENKIFKWLNENYRQIRFTGIKEYYA